MSKVDLSNTRNGKKDQLLKINRQLKYIDFINIFQSDVIQYSHYSDKQHYYFVLMFYEMARKRVFTTQIDYKNKKSMINALRKFIEYIMKFPDQQVNQIITDEGIEFLNKDFTTVLQSLNIKHVTIDSSLLSKYKALSHINVKCRDFRTYLDQHIETFSSPLQELQKQCDNYNKFHNFEHIIKEYKVPPNQITIEMIQNSNKRKQLFNNAIKDKFNVYVGDIVKIQLFKDDLHTKHRQKFSNGLYKVINKIGQNYIVSPMNYDKETYIQYLYKVCDNDSIDQWKQYISVPCFQRKAYQLKIAKQLHKQYYPEEPELTQYYQIYEILECYKDKKKSQIIDDPDQIKGIEDKIYYDVLMYPEKKLQRSLKNLRQYQFEETKMSQAEKQYWYGLEINIIPIIKFSIQ